MEMFTQFISSASNHFTLYTFYALYLCIGLQLVERRKGLLPFCLKSFTAILVWQTCLIILKTLSIHRTNSLHTHLVVLSIRFSSRTPGLKIMQTYPKPKNMMKMAMANHGKTQMTVTIAKMIESSCFEINKQPICKGTQQQKVIMWLYYVAYLYTQRQI